MSINRSGRSASSRRARRAALRAAVRGARRSRAVALASGLLLPALARPAAAQDLRFSISPTAQQVAWNDALGLDNTLLYGGRVGFVFGRRIELQGYFLTNQGSDAGIRDLYDQLGVNDRPPQNAGLGVRNYGAALVYNFSVGGFTPFLRAGGSILRFEPEGGRRSDRIALGYGGGLRFGKPGSLRFNLFAEDLRFRIDRTLLLALPATGAPPIVDVDANKLRSNLTYGAGLSIPLGGGAVTYDDTPQYQLSNVALPAEVFAGRLDFAGASGLPNQYVTGVRTGIDFGPLVGLRAFYWRGVSDGFNKTAGIQGYGGEAQFALNAGPGFNPFLLAGAGQLDFLDSYDYNGEAATPGVVRRQPADQTALILGGGVKIPIGARFTLTAAARNYLAARGGRTEDVAEASQLRSNWQYSAGFSFGIGGRGARRRAESAPRTASAPRTDTVFVDRASRRRVESAGTVDLAPTTPAVVDRYVVTARGDTLRGTRADSVLAADRAARLVEVRAAPAAAPVTVVGAPTGAAADFAGDRTVAVIVPTEGEITVRYGPQRRADVAAGDVTTRQAIREEIRAALREELAAAPVARRTFVREYRDGTRLVREYREPDNRVLREYTDDRGRVVHEFRDDRGRVTRQYVPAPIPLPAPGAPAPTVRSEYVAPTSSYAPAPAPAPGAPATAYAPPAAAAAPNAPYAPPAPTTTTTITRSESGLLPPSGQLVQKSSAGELVAGTPVPAEPAPAELPAQSPAPAAAPGAAVPAASDAERARLAARVDSLEAALAARDAALAKARVLPAAPATSGETVTRTTTTSSTGAVAPAPAVAPTVPPAYASGGVQGAMLYSGATLSSGTQALVGLRLDFGVVSPRVPGFRLVPELAFGFGGGGTTSYIAANAMYEVGPFFRVRPRVSLGGGLLNYSSTVGGRSGTDLVLTPAYGFSLPLSGFRGIAGRTPELVVEHQGVDLFDVNRLVVGLGFRR